MSFEYGLSDNNKTTLTCSGFEYTKKQQPKRLFIGFADKLNSSAAKPPLLPAATPYSSFLKDTAVDVFPGRQKPEKLWLI